MFGRELQELYSGECFMSVFQDSLLSSKFEECVPGVSCRSVFSGVLIQ